MRATLITVFIAATLLLAACGGGESGSDEYAAQLNDACSELQTKLAGASVQAKEQGTSASELSQQYTTEFRAQVEDLEPPADLEEGDQALRDQLDSLPAQGIAPDEAIGYYEELGSIYSDLGADDCAAAQAATVKTLGQVKNGIFETGGQGG